MAWAQRLAAGCRSIPFWWLAAALAVLHLSLALAASWHKSVTMDEAGHLAAGLATWTRADTRIAPGDPPLVRLLTTLPVLALTPQVPQGEGWRSADVLRFQNELAIANRDRYQVMVRLARSVAALLGALTVLLVAYEARALAGPAAALTAAALLAVEPSFTAHAGLATVDVGAALLALLWLVLVRRYLDATGPARRLLVAAGVAGGLAVSAKLTIAALTLPVIVLVVLAARHRRSLRFLVTVLAAWLVLGLTTINLCYLGDSIGSRAAAGSTPLRSPALAWLDQEPLRSLPLPVPNRFVEGLDADLRMRHSDYGQHVQTEISSLSYAWSVLNKATLPALLLLLLVTPGLLRLRERQVWGYLGSGLLFVAVLSLTHYMHGIRFLLPAWPMLAIAVAGGCAPLLARGRWWQLTVVVLLLAHLGATVAAMPDLIPYRNLLSPALQRFGPPLRDSDVDWGQDLPALRRFMERQGIGSIALLYFGGVDPAIYGIDWHYPSPMVRDEWVAISVAYLRGQVIHVGKDGRLLGVPEPLLVPYRDRQPTTTLGGSIALFRATPKTPASPGLASSGAVLEQPLTVHGMLHLFRREHPLLGYEG